MTKIIRVVDTETTGLDPKKNACVVEIASVDIAIDTLEIHNPQSFFVAPTTPLHPKAMAINRITEDMLEGADNFETVLKHFDADNVLRYVAHNAAFDSKFIKPFRPDWSWMCTYKLAKQMWQLPSYSNENLYRELYKTTPVPEELTLGVTSAHRAIYDASKTAFIMKEMLKVMSKG